MKLLFLADVDLNVSDENVTAINIFFLKHIKKTKRITLLQNQVKFSGLPFDIFSYLNAFSSESLFYVFKPAIWSMD